MTETQVWFLCACASVLAFSAALGGGALLWIALAARRLGSDIRYSVRRISGSISAAHELVRRATGKDAKPDAEPESSYMYWENLFLNRKSERR